MRLNIKKKLKKGFSLIEIIIWVTIATVIGGMITISSVLVIQNSKVSTTMQDLNTYSTGLLYYWSAYGSFPSQEDGLMVLLKEKLIQLPPDKLDETDPNKIFTDGWKKPLIYTIENDGQGYTLKSLGSDNKEGGTGFAKDLILSSGNVNPNE